MIYLWLFKSVFGGMRELLIQLLHLIWKCMLQVNEDKLNRFGKSTKCKCACSVRKTPWECGAAPSLHARLQPVYISALRLQNTFYCIAHTANERVNSAHNQCGVVHAAAAAQPHILVGFVFSSHALHSILYWISARALARGVELRLIRAFCVQQQYFIPN